MIIVKILGGLGNQMFQYAAGTALSLRLKQPLKLDLRGLFMGEDIRKTFELDIFGIEPTQATQKELRKYHRKTLFKSKTLQSLHQKMNDYATVKDHDFTYIPNFSTIDRRDLFLRGLFQSEQYFADVRPAILDTFTFKEPLDELNLGYVNKITACESISLHVRRGEFANDPKYSKLIGSCNIDYYKACIADIVEKLPSDTNINFFVFSDDLQWVKDNLSISYPTTYIEGNVGKASYRDLQLMSLCKHNIIANSTFSWWGAWLNNNSGKLVYAPQKWFGEWKHDTRDLIPATWNKR